MMIIIKFLLIATVTILAIGLLLWLIGLVLPSRRSYKTTVPVYLPLYMTIGKLEAEPFPKYFRGERNGDAFIQHLDRKGKSTITWKKTRREDKVTWETENGKAPAGTFRYAFREKGIMSELDYERTLTIRKPMMRVFGLMVSLKKEARELLKGVEGRAAADSRQ